MTLPSGSRLTDRTGRGVSVAIIDSGVNAMHPHVRFSGDGIAIREDGSLDADFTDRLGHGTAVAAVIAEKAPDAPLLVVKVFWQSLATTVSTLVRAIEVSCERGARLINLSLGTTNVAHRPSLETVVEYASSHGAIVIAALEDGGRPWLPGSIAGEVIPVLLDWQCDRHACKILSRDGRRVVCASGYPRDAAHLPRERNLKGISFAVANATGFVARALEGQSGARAADALDILAAAGAVETSVGSSS